MSTNPITWKPGDPCPFCLAASSIKYNGGQPKCLACGEFMPGPPRLSLPAVELEPST